MHRKKKGTNKIKLTIIEQGKKECREKGKGKQGNAEKQKGKKEADRNGREQRGRGKR